MKFVYMCSSRARRALEQAAKDADQALRQREAELSAAQEDLARGARGLTGALCVVLCVVYCVV